MSTLGELKEKIQSLEEERVRLANELEIMRKAAENRAIGLEEDVDRLREESKTLRELLFSDEKIGVAGSMSKPVAAAPVKASAETVPEIPVQPIVPEKVETQAFVSSPAVVPTVDAIPQPSIEVVSPTLTHEVPKDVSDTSAKEMELEKSFKSEITSQDDSSKTLTADEQKIIDILCDHGGRYARTNIRAEAGLGWLQTNRVISHLAERGIIGMEKSGASMELVLKETP